MLGTLLNERFKILQALGSGGFGQTYLAEDIQQPDLPICVVKQFKPARRDASFLAIARRLFFSEVETLRRLGGHDQIPALLADFEDNHEFYLVQEYIDGEPLSDELAAVKRLSEAEVTKLLRDVLQVLDFVHQNQVIHRDIKPANLIRRREDGKFVLIDFGAVKEIQTQITQLPTESGQTNLTVGIGTQGYGPSEQLMGKPRFNSDLYALGMTAIEALTGLQPAQLPTHPDTAEVIWHDQVEVSPKLVVILSQMVRYHFSQRYQSVREVLHALDQPSAGFAALLSQVPLTEPLAGYLPTRPLSDGAALPERLTRKPQRPLMTALWIGLASVAMTACVAGMRQLGWLQSLEVAVWDRMVQLSPASALDERLLVVGITDADIQAQKRFPLTDRTVAQVIKTLNAAQPRAIGLDLLRDIPQEPGHQELVAQFKTPNLITITNLGNATVPATPPPPGIPPERVGFNDFVLDTDGTIRRNLMFADNQTTTLSSFSLRLALMYLNAQSIAFQANTNDRNTLKLGKAVFTPLERHAGGYETVDDQGFQILLRYRGRTIARQVSLSDVLDGKVKPEWVKDKVVLIGTTAISGKDLFFTPYSAIETEMPRMAGVLIHAQMVSQILDAALMGRSLLWYWQEWVEILWIGGWALLGGSLAWAIRHPLLLFAGQAGVLLAVSATGFGLFVQQGWVPIAAPAIAAIGTASLIRLRDQAIGGKTKT